MSKNANPYREGTEYHIGFAAIKANQIITRSALIVILTEAITAKRQAATEVPVHLAKRYDSLEAYQSQEAIDKAAQAAATVLLSPRGIAEDQNGAKEGQILSISGRGDCRGNASSMGHKYFVEALKNKSEDGEKRFRIRFRKVELDRLTYSTSKAKKVKEVKQQKTATNSKSKAKAKTATVKA